jgi:preprotein translocase subunit SecD
VATTRSAKNPTQHNDTPDTPKVREGAIAKMKVDELRRKLRGHGVKGTAELKKPELVQKLIKAEVSATKKTSPAKTKATKSKATKTTATKTTATKSKSAKSAAKNPTSHNDTPNTPGVSETAIATMKADDLRRRLRGHGVKGTAELKKPELVRKLTKIEVGKAKKSASATSGSAKAGAGKAKR